MRAGRAPTSPDVAAALTPTLLTLPRLVAINLVAAVVIAALAALSLYSSREAHRERAVAMTESVAALLARTVQNQIDEIDLVLRGAGLALDRERAGGQPDAQAMERALAARREFLPLVAGLRVTDAAGRVHWGSGPPSERPLDVADRVYFQRLRDDPGLGLFVSEPLVGRATGEWIIVLARRWETEPGRFGGIVYAAVRVEQLRQLLEGVALGDEGAISLRTATMKLVARVTPTPVETAVGSGHVSPQLQRSIADQPARGSYSATTALDQITRINAYARAGDHPLYLIVGLGTRELMASWRTQVAQVAAMATMAIALVFAASALAWRESRRSADQARQLAAQARRHQALLRTASDGIHVLDAQGRIVELSDSFAAMLGYPRERVIGMHPRDWDASASTAQVAQWLGDSRRQTSFQTRHRRSDGSLIDVEVTSAEVHIDGQDFIYCCARDVSERLRLQRVLAERSRNLAAMTSVSSDITLVIDADLRVQVANRAFENAWHLVPGSAAGLLLDELFGPHLVATHLRPEIDRVLAGVTVSARRVLELPGRPARAYDVVYEPVRNASDAIVGVVFTAHDVDELVRSRDELSATVQRLEQTHAALEQFVRITSHDMREPLNTVVQFVGLIEQQAPTALAPPLDRYFAFVRRAAQRMKAMLDDVQQFVRLDAQAAEEPIADVALDEVMREVEVCVAGRLASSGARLEIAALPRVRGRAAMLTLLFQNLVSNGLKFVAPGTTPHVRVVDGGRDDQGRVTILVEDDGIGIAPQQLPTLFEPFRRLHRRQAYEGTGLGLAISRRIVESCGGAIEMVSQPGQGTCVIVHLPAAEARA